MGVWHSGGDSSGPKAPATRSPDRGRGGRPPAALGTEQRVDLVNLANQTRPRSVYLRECSSAVIGGWLGMGVASGHSQQPVDYARKRGNCLISQKTIFISSAMMGEQDEHHEAVSTPPEDFEVVRVHLREPVRTCEVTLYAESGARVPSEHIRAEPVNGVRNLFSPCRDCRLTDGLGLHQHQAMGRVEQPEAFGQDEHGNE